MPTTLRLIALVFAVGAGTTAHFAGAIYVNVRRQIDEITADECDNMRRMADEIEQIDPTAPRDTVPEICAGNGNRSE
ncbi:hypothetical protein DNX69_00030 [Rhodopseudomonas palustris]|uniref:Uncharacterized protein n=1 Tax=Rhodopseudomonas palustris TaxID=1076 RepID=A0A323UNA6_RHOPL|nr:hypothetical protein [Rhodopseudomonas palustris]PZA13869.1 hypothetical protein DNX69_00030 [Rhodopseudomonas palustris]